MLYLKRLQQHFSTFDMFRPAAAGDASLLQITEYLP